MKRIVNQIIGYALPIALCFVVGLSASYFQSESLAEWYPLLRKPSITPPNWVFPIAWGIIYVCMGVSLGRLMLLYRDQRLITLWVVQLVVNFLWSIFFFTWRNPLLGLVDILLLYLLVLLYIAMAWRVDRVSAWLFVPYLLWLTLATYLNAYIYLYN